MLMFMLMLMSQVWTSLYNSRLQNSLAVIHWHSRDKMQILRESHGNKIQWNFTDHYQVSKRCPIRFSKRITIKLIKRTHYVPHGGNLWLRTQKQKLCNSNNTVLSLLYVRDGPFYFWGGDWANAKKISCTAFAEEIKIAHSAAICWAQSQEISCKLVK